MKVCLLYLYEMISINFQFINPLTNTLSLDGDDEVKRRYFHSELQQYLNYQ